MGKKYQVGEATRNKILQVSKELFYEKGYEATVYDDICKKAQVNRALIPYYFKNKSDLALAAYNSLMQEFVRTRSQLGKDYTDAEKIILDVYYYYKLLYDPKLARFVAYVSGVSEYYDRMFLGEKVLFEELEVDGHKLPKRKLDALVHLYMGMSREVTAMFAQQRYEEAEYMMRMAVQMLFQYLGIEEKEVSRMMTKVRRMLNRYEVRVHPDFTISLEKKEKN